MMKGLSGVLLALCGVTALGCDGGETDTNAFVVPTEIAVDPLDFRGQVGCSLYQGAMRSYVMTLHNYEDESDTTPFTIGSTVPTPCSLVAGFRDVILINQRYTADIDAYDVPIEDLTPFGGFASGARQMRDATTGDVVAPRWTTHCGGGAATAAIAQVQRRVFVRPCDPLVDHDPSATQLAVPPSAVLGADACSVADSYDISFDQGDLPGATSIPCGAADGALYDVEDGVTYVIYATAMVDGALSGSLCLATGRQGETVTPTCQPLTPNGNAKLDLATLMNGAEPVCPDGALYDVLADGSDALNPVPIPCNQAANLGPFPPGLMLFSALIYDSMGAAVSSASCSAIIEPGRIVDAVCVP